MPIVEQWTDLRALSMDIHQAMGPEDRLVLGDMHCNPIYLINKLHQLGVLDIDEPTYETMATRYYDLLRVYEDKVEIDVPEDSTYIEAKNTIAKNIMYQFAVLIPSIKLKQAPACLSLLGDLFADRGPNDFLMMLMLTHLVKLGIPLDINLSNHDYEYICWVEDQYEELSDWVKNSGFANSLVNFESLLDEFAYSTYWIERFHQIIYAPSLKLITYDIVSPNEIILYGHGAFDKRVIRSMAAFLSVEFKSGTVYELADTIDRIQNEFNSLIQSEELYFASLFPESKRTNMSIANYEKNPFLHLLWNRPEFTREFEARRSEVDAAAQVDDFSNFRTTIIHGHDLEDGPNAHSLDSFVGKFYETRGETKAFITRFNVQVEPSEAIIEQKKTEANDLELFIETELKDWSESEPEMVLPFLRLKSEARKEMPTITTTDSSATELQDASRSSSQSIDHHGLEEPEFEECEVEGPEEPEKAVSTVDDFSGSDAVKHRPSLEEPRHSRSTGPQAMPAVSQTLSETPKEDALKSVMKIFSATEAGRKAALRDPQSDPSGSLAGDKRTFEASHTDDDDDPSDAHSSKKIKK